MLDVWRFAFFGDSVSGAIILGLSGTLTGAASAPCGATPDPIAAVIVDEDAAATLTFALAVAAAVAVAGAGAELLADNDVAGADGAGVADAVGTSAGVAVATVEGGAAGGGLTACGIARAVVRAEALGLSATGARAGTALTAIAGELTAAVPTVGATDGTAVSRTLVTMARAAIGVFCASAGRSTSDRTTPAPAVAPIAVATRTTRAVRAKLGAGAK